MDSGELIQVTCRVKSYYNFMEAELAKRMMASHGLALPESSKTKVYVLDWGDWMPKWSVEEPLPPPVTMTGQFRRICPCVRDNKLQRRHRRRRHRRRRRRNKPQRSFAASAGRKSLPGHSAKSVVLNFDADKATNGGTKARVNCMC